MSQAAIQGIGGVADTPRERNKTRPGIRGEPVEPVHGELRGGALGSSKASAAVSEEDKVYMGLLYRVGQDVLTVTVDANWGGCSDTRRSTSGFVCKTGESTIACKSRLLETVALSSAESEYVVTEQNLRPLTSRGHWTRTPTSKAQPRWPTTIWT